jgi:hypothetical protein
LEALLIGCGHRTRVSPRESWPFPRSLLQSFKRSELLRLPELAIVFVCFDHVASVDYTRPYVYPHPLVTGASPTPSATPTPEEPLQKKRKEAKKKQTRQKMALPRRGGTYLQAIQTLHRGLGTPFLERFYSVASI